jgi:hypothetical protein
MNSILADVSWISALMDAAYCCARTLDTACETPGRSQHVSPTQIVQHQVPTHSLWISALIPMCGLWPRRHPLSVEVMSPSVQMMYCSGRCLTLRLHINLNAISIMWLVAPPITTSLMAGVSPSSASRSALVQAMPMDTGVGPLDNR